MSLRHAILGLLERQPSTGYELTGMFDRSLATTWHARHSQIYPELARLEAAGQIRLHSRGARRSKTWEITPAGREELHRWLLEEEPDRSQRNESGVRFFLTLLLPPSDRARIFARDLAHLRAEMADLSALREQLTTGDRPEPFAPQVDLGLAIDAAIESWLVEQIDRAGTPEG